MSIILVYVTSSFIVPDLDHRPCAGKRMGADLGSGSCDFILASSSDSLALVPVTPDDAGDVSCAAHVGTRSSGLMRSLLHLSRGCVQLFLDELDSAYDCQVLADCLTGNAFTALLAQPCLFVCHRLCCLLLECGWALQRRHSPVLTL